jgi:phosphoribosylamine--glycine ligase
VTGARVGVVLASGGYPGAMTTGYAIDGLEAAAAVPGVTVFQAGTRLRQGSGGQAQNEVVTSGGRVLTVVGEGPDLRAARDRAYQGVARISFTDMEFRRDIAAKYV